MNLKKVLSSTLVFFLSTSMIFSAPATVSATTNDVFGVTASFKGADETGIKSLNATFSVGMGEDKDLGNDFKASVDLYIPLPLLSNKDSSLLVSFTGYINKGPGFAPTPVGIFDFRDYVIKNNNGTYVVIYPGSDMESASATEIVGDYAKVHLTTNMDHMVYWVFNEETSDFGDLGEYVPNPDNHCDEIVVNVHSSDVSKDATIYIDNFKLVSGTTTLLDTDFSNLTEYEWLTYTANGSFPQQAEPVPFNQNLLTLSKKATTVKVGEKITVEATAAPAAKITYKSNKKKVAKVDS